MAEPELSFEDHDVWRKPEVEEPSQYFTVILQYSDGSIDHEHIDSPRELRQFTAKLNQTIKMFRECWLTRNREKRVLVSYRVDSDWSPYGRNYRDY